MINLLKIHRIHLFCLSFLLVFTTAKDSAAQIVSDPIIKKINALFERWDNPQSPGCVVGIVRNDSLIFSKGYGSANLEYTISNSPETIYHLASVSKQFTAYSIILLAKEGKLNLDDDIHKYLKWFPDLKHKITIRNLLNHTSGIRDQWQLLGISGTRLDDVITQDQIIKILSKQQALNFNPGERFMYSNSGYTLLSEIVKSASGQSLRKFADSAIFKPLGMTNTHFHDDYTEVEKNRAYSYSRKDNTRFSNAILSYSTVGATSLFSNISDLSKWAMNFYDTKVGDQNTLAQLTQKGELNDGKEQNYAAGIISGNYKGWKQYSHDGADAAYRAYITVLPELKMSVIVLSNIGDVNTMAKANQILDLFIHPKTSTAALKSDLTKRESRVPAADLPIIKKVLGDYIHEESPATMSLKLRNDSLFYHAGPGDYLLMKESDTVYSMSVAPDNKFIFNPKQDNKVVIVRTPNETGRYIKFTKNAAPDDKILQAYIGVYYCPELDCNYGIILKDHTLYLTNNKYNDTRLDMAGEDHLTNSTWWMNHLIITRNSLKKITGFEVNSGRVMHLKFIKIK
jgi:CubicO group peptidase (beta-lactamase class C family)